MNDCIFCKIAQGEIPSQIVYEDETVLAFRDVAPQAPVHILVIPRKHIANVYAAREEDDALLAHLLRTAATVAGEQGLEKTGFRLVTNCGADAKQSVEHMHIHILGGGALSGQMG